MKARILTTSSHVEQQLARHIRRLSSISLVSEQADIQILSMYHESDQSLIPLIDATIPTVVITASIQLFSSQIFPLIGQGIHEVAELSLHSPSNDEDDNLQRMLLRVEKAISHDSLSSSQLLWIIGCSTGGPQALAELLPLVEVRDDLAIVIIQHIDHQFTDNLINWLGQQVPWGVEGAVEGNAPETGKIIVAQHELDLGLNADMNFHYSRSKESGFYRPSISHFIETVTKYWKHEACASILTGMGDDGSSSINDFLHAGYRVWLQEFSSCVIDAMPRAVDRIHPGLPQLSLMEMAQRLNKIELTGQSNASYA